MRQLRHRIHVRPYDGIWSRYIGFIYEVRGGAEYPLLPARRSVIRGRHKDRVIAKARKVVVRRCVEHAREEAQRAQETSHSLVSC